MLKRTITVPVNQVGNRRALIDFTDRVKNPLTKIIDHEERLCNSLGLTDCEVIIDFPEIPKTKEVDFPVVIDDNYYKPLEEISAIARASQEQRRDDWMAYVFCSNKEKEIKIKEYLEHEFYLNLE